MYLVTVYIGDEHIAGPGELADPTTDEEAIAGAQEATTFWARRAMQHNANVSAVRARFVLVHGDRHVRSGEVEVTLS